MLQDHQIQVFLRFTLVNFPEMLLTNGPKYTLDKGESLKGKLHQLHDKFTPHLDGVNSGCIVGYQDTLAEIFGPDRLDALCKAISEVFSTCWCLDSTQRIDPFRPPSLLPHFLVQTGPAS